MSYGHVGPVKSWGERLLEFALSVLAAAFVLHWAWQLLKPLVPIIAIVSGLIVIVVLIIRWHREW